MKFDESDEEEEEKDEEEDDDDIMALARATSQVKPRKKKTTGLSVFEMLGVDDEDNVVSVE